MLHNNFGDSQTFCVQLLGGVFFFFLFFHKSKSSGSLWRRFISISAEVLDRHHKVPVGSLLILCVERPPKFPVGPRSVLDGLAVNHHRANTFASVNNDKGDLRQPGGSGRPGRAGPGRGQRYLDELYGERALAHSSAAHHHQLQSFLFSTHAAFAPRWLCGRVSPCPAHTLLFSNG